jgi:nucleoside-diphosphate-sugar epimerase
VKTVIVTGGSGKAGRAVVEELTASGYDVVNVDTVAPWDPNTPSLIADLTHLGQTADAIYGADIVVHLAAVPAPNILPDGETFRINTMSTYNVFSAAVKAGVEKVVWASSETLIGIPFESERPRYAPIDERHPRLPEFHYALTKLLGEEMAGQFYRWTGIPFTSLRFSNVMEPHDYAKFPGFWDDPSIRAWNLWGYVDARDVAQSVRLSIESDIDGHEAFLIAAADTCMSTPSIDLMAKVYPETEIRGSLGSHDTLLSIDKAREMLSYEPTVSWRDYIEAP